MSVEARFYVQHVGMSAGPGGEPHGTVKLQVSTKGPNNWSKWTPAGEVTMATLNSEALAWFNARLGKDVAVTFRRPARRRVGAGNRRRVAFDLLRRASTTDSVEGGGQSQCDATCAPAAPALLAQW